MMAPCLEGNVNAASTSSKAARAYNAFSSLLKLGAWVSGCSHTWWPTVISCHPAGLNLTTCNHVILVDPWWNPALEVSICCLMSRLNQTHILRLKQLIVFTASGRHVLSQFTSSLSRKRLKTVSARYFPTPHPTDSPLNRSLVWQLQVKKCELTRATLDSNAFQAEKLSIKQLQGLFRDD